MNYCNPIQEFLHNVHPDQSLPINMWLLRVDDS